MTEAAAEKDRNELTTSYVDGRLTVTGEVRAHNADALRRAITDPDAEGLITVDMSAVTSLDRAGIRALRAARRVRPFRIVDPSPHVLQVLRGSGTAGMFGIANAPEPEPLGRFRRHARSRTYAVPTTRAS